MIETMGHQKLLSVLDTHTVFTHREGKRINVKNTCSVFKYFKTLVASKSQYSKQDSH